MTEVGQTIALHSKILNAKIYSSEYCYVGFCTKRFAIRLTGNFLVSFLSPLMGINILLTVEFLDTVLVALLSASVVTGIVLGRELERYEQAKK